MALSSRAEEAGQGARDRRVIAENIKAGRGYSSAEHKPKAKSTSPYTLPRSTKAKPAPRPDRTKTGSIQGMAKGPSDPGEDRATRFRPDAWTAAVGNTPNPYGTQFSPDLAPSPNPYALGSPVNPRTMPAGPTPAQFSPDLAPSPNPYAINSPVNPLAMPMGPAGGARQMLGGNPLVTPGQPSGTSPILGGNRPVIDINKLFGY